MLLGRDVTRVVMDYLASAPSFRGAETILMGVSPLTRLPRGKVGA